ncbi:MAG: acyl-CoA dehydrogenase family protein [Actinobacteria bacterium]|nr:acyl-CoA dehydrogenase family protein [Actinomycetota bacterium]
MTDASFEAHRRWNAELYDAGWAAVAWPAEYGGRDADLGGQLAVAEELAATGAPGPVNAIGVANIAPAIMAVGTPEQRERFLRPMLRGDEIWCQGMSEPDAGSDSRRCGAAPNCTATTSWSTARRRGTPTATGRTGASCTCAPARTRRAIAGSAALVDMARPASRSAPSPRWPATRASPTCSSTTCEFRRTRCSARSTRGGRWPPARCPTSAPGSRCWRCNGAASSTA